MKFDWTGLAFAAFIALGGCSETLETGYVPNRLNANDAERRAYYAPEFSPESQPSKDKSVAPDLMGHH